MKNILAIIGSASANSSSHKLADFIQNETRDAFRITVFDTLKSLPHFDPALSDVNTPKEIIDFRKQVETADGILMSTPEYIFSIPSGLKNAIEWCVSTTVFSHKPLGIITASAQGEKGHAELQLIMKTVMANFTPETTLLIQGVKGKVNKDNTVIEEETKYAIQKFIAAYIELMNTDNR